MNDNKRAIFTIAFVFILGFFLIRLKKDFNSSKNSSFEITEKEIMRHIQYLSHEDRKGRKPGTRESRDVIAYLIKELKSYGIKPGVKNQSYTQPFDIETGIKLGENNFLTINNDSLEVNKDYIPLWFSSNKSESSTASASVSLVTSWVNTSTLLQSGSSTTTTLSPLNKSTDAS